MTDTTNAPSHRIDLPDGRTLALDEFGDPDGRPVLLLPSTPGSRRIDPDPAATGASGVRLLTVDRPGYGASSPYPAGLVPTFVHSADDLEAALAELGVDDVAVVGWSNGGLHALALAARHPNRVRALAIVAAPAHDDDVPWLPQEQRAMGEMITADPASARSSVEAAIEPATEHVEAGFGMLADGGPDDALVADPERRAQLLDLLTAAFAQKASGIAADIVIGHLRPWAFDPAAVGAPAALWYGADDLIVGPEHADWWHGTLADATVHVVPGAGHLLPLVAWKEILASVT